MVKMLISEFAREAGLSTDTVRYYVRIGLLAPRQGSRGGRNPYQEFSTPDVQIARMVRVGQVLGMSLKDIAAFLSAGEEIQLKRLREQRDSLKARARELRTLSQYIDQKIEWVDAGMQGAPPVLKLKT
jgi:DNA-binding transcriptional MerR regulator